MNDRKYQLTIRGLAPELLAIATSFHDALHLAYYLHRCTPGVTCKMRTI